MDLPVLTGVVPAFYQVDDEMSAFKEQSGRRYSESTQLGADVY